MSNNFSLVLSNPRATVVPPSVVYTNVPGGNTLNVIIGNNFGFPVQIGGGSAGTSLVVQVTGKIVNAAGVAKLNVAAPWTIASREAPAIFHLLPPAGGITIPNGGSVTIELQDLEPSAVGAGLVIVQYQFDSHPADNLNVSASLSSLAPPDPKQPPLIGDNDALRLTIFVNRGAMSNPIMVSVPPLSPADTVKNRLHFNLVFQRAGRGPNLVPGWDPLHPPTFRVHFPYFTPFDEGPAPLDLTDSLEPGEEGYDPATSAWNIPGSLDPTNPAITDDGFWQIALDRDASLPIWLITPTAAMTCPTGSCPGNVHLFTAVEGSSSEPGPTLDFYLSSIVSALPIDQLHPETLVYLQWNDFPGFNDGIVVYPLRKTTLAINRFEAAVRRTDAGPELVVQWSTIGASYCTISGDTDRQPATAQGATAYRRSLTAADPLRSTYVLTAVSADGVTQVTQGVGVRWRLNSEIPHVRVEGEVAIGTTPDGLAVLVLHGSPQGVSFFNAETLTPRPMTPITPPDGKAANAFVMTADGETLFLTGFDGAAYGYDAVTLQPTPGSGTPFAGGNPSLYPRLLGLSLDNSALLPLIAQPFDGPGGSGTLVVLRSDTLQPTSASAVTLSSAPLAIAVGPQTGRVYLALASGLTVLDTAYQPVPGSPVNLARPGVLAVSPDEMSVYALSSSSDGTTFFISKISAATLAVQVELPVDFIFVPYFPLSAMTVSADGAILFVISPNAFNDTTPFITRMLAFDAGTLAKISWSPISFGSLLPMDLALSPDGSRLFVVAGENFGTPTASAYLHAVDPDFL